MRSLYRHALPFSSDERCETRQQWKQLRMPDTKRMFQGLMFELKQYTGTLRQQWVYSVRVCRRVSLAQWCNDLSSFTICFPPFQSKAFLQHLSNHQYDFVPICHNWSDNRSFHCCPGDKWVLQRKGSVHLTFTWWCSWIVTPFVVRDIVLRGLSGSHSINFHLAISSPCEWQVRASSIVRTNGNLDFQGLGYFLPGLGTLVSVWKKLYLCKTNLSKVSWKWALLVH